MKEQTNEWIILRMNDQTNERMNKRMKHKIPLNLLFLKTTVFTSSESSILLLLSYSLSPVVVIVDALLLMLLVLFSPVRLLVAFSVEVDIVLLDASLGRLGMVAMLGNVIPSIWMELRFFRSSFFNSLLLILLLLFLLFSTLKFFLRFTWKGEKEFRWESEHA